MLRKKYIFKSLTILFFIFLGQNVVAQKSGIIYKTAGTGAAVLDPNGDGYISATSAGFLTNDDLTESEIKYKPIPQVSSEPNSDLATGPNCGYSDFVDDGGEYSAGVFFDGTNFLFRFRLAGTADNSKGYSILIDTDQKIGAYGAQQDVNYVVGNPGFEIEVVLQSNFGVYLYDVDGTTSPVQKGSALSYTNYCQKAVAENIYVGSSCPSKYFYDFYIPLSVIQTYFPNFSSSTPLRMVANTVISPNSVLQGPISDIQGVNNTSYASADLAWAAAINNIYPTPLSELSSTSTTTFGTHPEDRSLNFPTLNGPILVGATSASVTVTAGGLIKIYKVGSSTPVCSTNVVSSGTYSVTGCTSFASGDQVYATLTETGKSESANSNILLVNSCTLTVSATPTAPVSAQNEKQLTGTCVSGATVKLYNNGVYYADATVTTTSWTYTFTGTGNFLIPCGTWQVTQTEASKCESALSDPYCQSNGNTNSVCATTYTMTATPTVTTPVYSTDKVVTGTSASGATIYFYVNNILTRTTTATGTSWTVDGLTLATNDAIMVRALATGTGQCRSLAASTTVQQVKLIAPVVTSPILAGAGSVTGSSVESDGTTITVYRTRSGSTTSIGTTTVSSNAWTLSSLGATVLQTGDVIYAVASTSGATNSDNSNSVTVQGPAETVTPTITTLTPAAGTTLISGTLPTGILTSTTYSIILYIDGVAIDTFTTTTGISTLSTTAWASNTLHSTNSYWDYLYSGGVLTAKAYRANTSSVGSPSNSVTVTCSKPSTLVTWTNSAAFLDNPATIDVNITLSESGVIYTLMDDGGNIAGNSKMGTGGTITLTSITLSTTTTLKVLAQKMEAGSCENYLTGSKIVTVDVEAVYTNNTTSKVGSYSNGETVATVTDADATITNASVTSGSLPSGLSLASNGTITISNINNLGAGTYNFTVTTSATLNGNTGTTATPLQMTFTGAALPVELISFTAEKIEGLVYLDWATAWEINNDYFEVHRSADGIGFKKIGHVKGNGNTTAITNYRLIDRSPLKGTSYYRLKQVDFNGAFEYSNIVSIRNHSATNTDTRIEVIPNPAQQHSAKLLLQNVENGAAVLTMHDAHGKLVAYKIINIADENKSIPVNDLTDKPLTAGVYHITIQTANTAYKHTFIIR